VLYVAVPPFWDWAVTRATWDGNAQACRAAGGACWAFIREKFWFSVFGLYPFEERWRPATMLSILVAMVLASTQRRFWGRWLLLAWAVAAPAMLVLMAGGVFGLTPVSTRLWGGLTITGVIAVYGLALGYPLAILLALGRRSELPLVRLFCTAVIECVRGVPLISLLFMAAIMLPLFLPEGVTLDRLARVLVAYTLFTAAYMAEVVRGGLQAMPRGQYEAADALGLSYWRKMRLVILPQALTLTIPAQVNTFIGLFKDTTLVVVIGVFDFFTTMRAALGDPNWLGFPTEAYLFAAAVYFVLCFGMSRYSMSLERSLKPEGAR
jgi:general L-amino acid transport system permease protein